MEETSTPDSPPKEGLQHRYNCPRYSDIVIYATHVPSQKLPPQSARKSAPSGGPREPRPRPTTKIYAHKIILAAGLRAFEWYFKSGAQGTRDTSDEDGQSVAKLHPENIHYCRKETTVALVRYIFGLPPSLEVKDAQDEGIKKEDSELEYVNLNSDNDQDSDYEASVHEPAETDERGAVKDWVRLCDAAEGFEIPDLRQLALGKIEEALNAQVLELDVDAKLAESKGIVKAEDSSDDEEDESAVSQFVSNVEFIHEEAVRGDTAAKVLAVRMCCQHFTRLRKQEAFNSFTEWPGFIRSMLDHVAERHSGVLW